MPPPIQIRPATPEDYPAVVAAGNAAYADTLGNAVAPFDAARMHEDDADRPAHCKSARWVAEVDGQVVGAVEFDQAPHRYHPRRFWFDLYVHPTAQRQGIGTALYNQAEAALLVLNASIARCGVREDLVAGVQFLQRRGWEEGMRTWESVLDVPAFDPTPYAGAASRLAAQGITIRTLAEMAGDPERNQKLYDLSWEIRQDLPAADAPTRPSMEDFIKHRLEDPHAPADAFFIAVDGPTYLGYLTHHLDTQDPTHLKIGQLGVGRAHRGRGVAWGLKLRGVAYAQAGGFRTLSTDNAATNAPILHINEQLGFRRLPAWLELSKTFAPE